MKDKVVTEFLWRSPQGPGIWLCLLAFEFVLGLATEDATVGVYK